LKIFNSVGPAIGFCFVAVTASGAGFGLRLFMYNAHDLLDVSL
jgi:hypothetical protein